MGWYITLAILVLLAILPLGASVLYDEDGARVRIVAGPLKIQVFPMKKKPKKEALKKAHTEEKDKTEQEKEKKRILTYKNREQPESCSHIFQIN